MPIIFEGSRYPAKAPILTFIAQTYQELLQLGPISPHTELPRGDTTNLTDQLIVTSDRQLAIYTPEGRLLMQYHALFNLLVSEDAFAAAQQALAEAKANIPGIEYTAGDFLGLPGPQ